MARKTFMTPMTDAEIPVFIAMGRKIAEEGKSTERQKENRSSGRRRRRSR